MASPHIGFHPRTERRTWSSLEVHANRSYQRATAKEKIDYLVLSPALRKKVEHVDVFRKGFYSPRKWEAFENITSENKGRLQASDHHCVWADLALLRWCYGDPVR